MVPLWPSPSISPHSVAQKVRLSGARPVKVDHKVPVTCSGLGETVSEHSSMSKATLEMVQQ